MSNTFVSRLKRIFNEERLQKRLIQEITPHLSGLVWSLRPSPTAEQINLDRAKVIEPNDDDIEVCKRIMESYSAMHRDLRVHPQREIYYPSSLWERNIRTGFCEMIEAAKVGDIDRFSRFLVNSLSFRKPLGIMHGGTGQDFIRLSYTKKIYLKKVIFGSHLALWQYLGGYSRSLSDLEHSRFGNPDGALIDGHFIPAHAFFHEYYSWILSKRFMGTQDHVVADLGGGYATLLYYLLRKSDSITGVDFDLPETACVAAYFLMRSFPNKKFYLYGEDGNPSTCYEKSDICILPPQVIEKFPDRAVELFMNTNSLGEMRAITARQYITHIARLAKYFFHRNKEFSPRRFPDGSNGLIAPQFNIPESAKLEWRYPCIIQNVHRHVRTLDYHNDTFTYLYKFYES